MANQKLQVSRALPAVTSDTIDIPEVSNKAFKASSTATSTTADKLVDTARTFITDGIKPGHIVHNTTDGTIATVTVIDSETTLSISADIMASAEVYDIYTETTQDCVLYIGALGNIRVLTTGNDDITFCCYQGFLPVHVKRVFATGTTATDIIANW